MNLRVVPPAQRIRFDGPVPGDKSISHRALMLAAIGRTSVSIHGLGLGEDVRSTMACLQALGVTIQAKPGCEVVVQGCGPKALKRQPLVLDCGNSGTTARLLCGLLAGIEGMDITLTGDESLRRRPMARIVEPLRKMGARVEYLEAEGRLPFRVLGKELLGTEHILAVASAQVASAILLAGLHAKGETQVHEPIASRNHTQLMLRAFGADLETQGLVTSMKPGTLTLPTELHIPGDFSSAAFWLVLAALHQDADVRVRRINLNPTRTGLLEVLRKAGAEVDVVSQRVDDCGELVGDMRITSGNELQGVMVDAADVPSMIDELPLLALLGARANGSTTLRGAAELRVKESDRISTLASISAEVGLRVEELEDGFEVAGGQLIRGGKASSRGDHRFAMWLGIAGALSAEGTEIEGWRACEVSYPGYFEVLEAASTFPH